ncbi:RsmD family RNA methyltransferase [Lysinibacter sp. HNR]|uniref:RsmD family RNA methyltransferase n=1 Tax=Lysinibacter sp. HNR TaxID=3031408 RepID=UPI002435CA57|nr:RsmD family RNA methyltransferase [Lysinibacter sp. HNR]WGD38398.1 RsmD family RNA methyltransferase [Lysinibacter sp. HNR]
MTRIISGYAGSLRLNVPKSGTRPTSDRVREAIFSALDSWNVLPGSHVIDLYAGSGALGLEAISRGASRATLVEKNPAAAAVARTNARSVIAAYPRERAGDPPPRINVVARGVSSYLESATVAADVIFVDPPYELSEELLQRDLDRIADLLSPHGIALIERSSRSPEPAWPSTLTQFRRRDYGETTLWWIELSESRPPAAE